MRTVEGYLDLVTNYHRARPRYRATLDLSIAPAVGVGSVVAGLPRAFDLDEAIGTQLDRVGEWIGYTRFVTYPLPHAWFSLGDAARGFGKGRWKIPEDPRLGVIRLDDDIYRQLLRAKVRLNHWDGLASTAGVIFETFLDHPETYPFVVDRHNGTQRLAIAGEIPSLQRLVMLAQDYLPGRPAGVLSRTLVTSVNKAPIFGLGVQNRKISGFGAGAWPVTPQYLVDHGYAVRRPRPLGSDPNAPGNRAPYFGLGRDDTDIAGFGRGVWKPLSAA